MNDVKLDTVEVGARDNADASVIWLHGLGADGHDFEPIVPELKLPRGAAVRFVFPHAPVRPVTVNAGMAMPAWFDLYGIGASLAGDEAGVREAAGWLDGLIRRENRRGVPSERIVVAGFSQGGAVALHAGLRHPQRLAGIMGLSTYLPLADAVADEGSEANRETPVLLAHGSDDPVLPVALGAHSRDALKALGYAVEWHTYPMAHSVCLEEIRDIGVWLARVLPVAA